MSWAQSARYINRCLVNRAHALSKWLIVLKVCITHHRLLRESRGQYARHLTDPTAAPPAFMQPGMHNAGPGGGASGQMGGQGMPNGVPAGASGNSGSGHSASMQVRTCCTRRLHAASRKLRLRCPNEQHNEQRMHELWTHREHKHITLRFFASHHFALLCNTALLLKSTASAW